MLGEKREEIRERARETGIQVSPVEGEARERQPGPEGEQETKGFEETAKSLTRNRGGNREKEGKPGRRKGETERKEKGGRWAPESPFYGYPGALWGRRSP